MPSRPQLKSHMAQFGARDSRSDDRKVLMRDELIYWLPSAWGKRSNVASRHSGRLRISVRSRSFVVVNG